MNLEKESFGYVKIYRKILDYGYSSEYIHLFLYLIINCNFKDTFYNDIKLKKGQLLTGRKKISINTGINESKIERLLSLMESEQQIEQQKTNKFRIITIKNYRKYQQTEQQNEQQPTTDEQQKTHNKKEEKEEKDKKIKENPIKENEGGISMRINNINYDLGLIRSKSGAINFIRTSLQLNDIENKKKIIEKINLIPSADFNKDIINALVRIKGIIEEVLKGE
jgi:hypothetical protein